MENRCYSVPDVSFEEDPSQVHDGTAAHNLGRMRKRAAKFLKEHRLKGSIKGKPKRAAFPGDFRSEVVAPLFGNFNASAPDGTGLSDARRGGSWQGRRGKPDGAGRQAAPPAGGAGSSILGKRGLGLPCSWPSGMRPQARVA